MFSSTHKIILPFPLIQSFETLSSEANFSKFMHLSPTCHSVEIKSTDTVAFSPFNTTTLDLSKEIIRPAYRELTEAAPLEGNEEACQRIHFHMVERISLLFGAVNKDVHIHGTQIIAKEHGLHLYESVADNGVVTIYKIRVFRDLGGTQTEVEERIEGKTSWALRAFTEGACRKAHRAHMAAYHTLFATGP